MREAAISEDELYHRRYGSSARRCTQGQRMALGVLGANVDHLAHGKVWCVDLKMPFCSFKMQHRSSVTSISDILWPYRRSLEMHADLLDKLRSHDVSFETSRKIANTWVEQPHLEEDSWDAKWEDLCEVEIDRWDNR